MIHRYLLTLLALGGVTVSINAQSAIDAMRLNQQDMKGTARFMSMGGAFGALGGDLTTLSQNPAGIGVYRNNEVGFTVDLDVQSASSSGLDGKFGSNQTKFLLNNIGGVLTLRLPSKSVPNLNFGFTYNKTASFNRRYGGNLGSLENSMTNWMAGIANSESVSVDEVSSTEYYDPYNPVGDDYAAPWMTILAAQSFLIYPSGNSEDPVWVGQYGDGTKGTGWYSVQEAGGVDSFNIAFGGNFGNVLFWGMDFDITSLSYTMNSIYGENMEDAYVNCYGTTLQKTNSIWDLRNYYNMSGTGFAYKLGLILRPIQEFRLGVAFHTPTYYNLSQTFIGRTDYSYDNHPTQTEEANNGVPGYNELRYRTPWHVIVSAAGVIGKSFILSADYEWTQTSRMNFKDPSYSYNSYWDYGLPLDYNSYYYVNEDIKTYYKNQNTFRIGAEYRLTPQFSVRAGYANVSSPVRSEAADGHAVIYTAGTMPEYRFDNSTNYYTAGLGYRTGGFYADLAYVHKHQSSTWHAFDSDPLSTERAPQAKLDFASNQIVLSLGYKF